MSKRAIQIGCVAAVIVVALLLRGRGPGGPLPETPEAAVNAFLDAAGRGDDEAYLNLLDDELRASLERTRSEVGVETFRQNLQRSAAGIKGLAITRPGDDLDETVTLDVELTFLTRKEQQRIVLAPRRGGWVITTLGTSVPVTPTIPYGTPVFAE